MTRIGLVLGGGGIVGQAYHAGVLAALENDLGWDPRTADTIVGTSAGSVTGALLRLGVSASELAEWWTGSRHKGPNNALLEVLGGVRDGLPSATLTSLLRPWRLPTWSLWTRILTEPRTINPWAALAALLPSGPVTLTENATEGFHGPLPEGLWICATERPTGRRVVFGSPGGPDASLFEAVAASCAIPTYFAPVVVNGREYLDGGLASPTNADLLASESLDLVVVVSPMSGSGTLAGSPLRRAAQSRLAEEVHRLQSTGIPVVRFEPGRRARRTMGVNFMSVSRSAPVLRAGFFEAGAHAARPAIATSLCALSGGLGPPRSRAGILAKSASLPCRPLSPT